MNIKLSSCLIGISILLYGCAAPQYKMQTAQVVKPRPDKTVGDGSHLKNVTMSRNFVTDSYNKNTNGGNTEGNEKINSIKPIGDTQPRAVILLENRILPSSLWIIKDYSLNVRKKNIEICKGFMKLQTVEAVEKNGIDTGDILKADRKNHVITYMPANGINNNNLPSGPEGCQAFVKSGYDYESSAEELSFIFKDKKIGKSPYLAVYESPSSPYTSMVLSIGDLSPEAINVLASKWPELIMKVYQHGDSIDPQIGIAVMLENDNSLKAAQKDAMWRNIRIGISGTTCGVVLAGSTITLNALLATPACKYFIDQATEALGYA